MNLTNNILRPFYLLIGYSIIGIISYGNHSVMFPTTLILTFVLIAIDLKVGSENKVKTILVTIVPFLTLLFFASLFGNDFSKSVLYLIFIPIIALFSYSFTKSYPLLKATAFLLLVYFLSFYVYSSVFVLFHKEKSSYEKKVFPNIDFINSVQEKVEFKKRYTVLDFWTTNCAICFQKFPFFDEINLKYKNNEIDFFSVHVPLPKEKFEDIHAIVDSLDYSYETIYSKSIKEVDDSLGINSFPHILILENDQIIYSGWMMTKQNIWGDNFEEQITELLKE